MDSPSLSTGSDHLSHSEREGILASVAAKSSSSVNQIFIGNGGYGDILRSVAPGEHVHFKVPTEMEKALTAEDLAYLRHKGCFSIPPESELLIQAYFEFVHPSFPILDLQIFLSDYADGGIESINLLLLWSMLSTAASYVPSCAHRATKEVFNDRAKLLFHLAPENNKIVVVQSALLLGFWFAEAQDVKQSWYWSGIAFSVGQSCGLHLDNSNCSSEERTLRRNLWRACMVRDVWLSFGQGRPLRLNAADCSIPEAPSPNESPFHASYPGRTGELYSAEEQASFLEIWSDCLTTSSVLREFLSTSSGVAFNLKDLTKIRVRNTKHPTPSLPTLVAQRHLHLHQHAALAAIHRRHNHHREAKTAAAATTSLIRLFAADSTVQYVSPRAVPLLVPATLIYLDDLKSETAPIERSKTMSIIEDYSTFLEAIEEVYPAASIMKRLIATAVERVVRTSRSPSSVLISGSDSNAHGVDSTRRAQPIRNEFNGEPLSAASLNGGGIASDEFDDYFSLCFPDRSG